MKTSISMWGNSASVRIPAPIMASSGLQVGQELDIRAEDGCIMLEPIKGAQGTVVWFEDINDEHRPQPVPAEIIDGVPKQAFGPLIDLAEAVFYHDEKKSQVRAAWFKLLNFNDDNIIDTFRTLGLDHETVAMCREASPEQLIQFEALADQGLTREGK